MVDFRSFGQFILDESCSWSMRRESVLANRYYLAEMIKGITNTSIRTVSLRRAH